MVHTPLNLLLLAVTGLGMALLGSAHAAPTELPPTVAAALLRAKIPGTAIALYVQDVNQNEPTLKFNSERAMNPASVMKLLTTYAALEVLGPAYRWRTEVYSQGAWKGEQLNGDLIFKGQGDPKITLEAFWLMLRELRHKGLKDLRGNLVLDRSYFNLTAEDPSAFDNEPFKPYNLGPDALLINFRAHRVRFLAQADNTSPRIVVDPEILGIPLRNEIKLGNGPCGDWREKIRLQLGASLLFSGQFPLACEDKSMNLVLQDNNAYFSALFKQLWEQLGGTWQGRVVEGKLSNNAVRLATFESPQLAEIIRDINKFSNNVMARHLFLTLGAEIRGIPTDSAKSADAVNDWLAVKGQRFLELVLDNGSGLSRSERINAQHLAWLLRAAFHSNVFAELESSLPIVAVDGTMKKRLVLGNVSGHAHIKSGSLKDVRAMAGYVFNAQGRRMVVVCIINHANADQASPVQDALLEWVFGR